MTDEFVKDLEMHFRQVIVDLKKHHRKGNHAAGVRVSSTISRKIKPMFKIFHKDRVEYMKKWRADKEASKA